MHCERCSREHDGTYGSGRFCSSHCANSRGERSSETREKISRALGGIGTQDRSCEWCTKTFKVTKQRELIRKFCSTSCSIAHQRQPKGTTLQTLWDCSPRTITTILRRLNKMKCSFCGWNRGTCDLHHIRGRKIENPHAHTNLTLVCPNCHRLVHENKILPHELITLDDFLGEEWKSAYFGAVDP